MRVPTRLWARRQCHCLSMETAWLGYLAPARWKILSPAHAGPTMFRFPWTTCLLRFYNPIPSSCYPIAFDWRGSTKRLENEPGSDLGNIVAASFQLANEVPPGKLKTCRHKGCYPRTEHPEPCLKTSVGPGERASSL